MVFPVVIYGCETWTIRKTEHQRIDAFDLWCWRRLLRVPWTARRSNQSILKEISHQSWIVIRRTDAKTETPILWPPDAKSWLICKDPNRKQSLSGLRPLKKRGGQQADGYLNNLSPWCEVLLPFCFVSLLVQSFSFCDPMDCSTPGCPVLHHLLELAQMHVHWVGGAI